MQSEFSLPWMKLRESNFSRVTIPFYPLVHAGYGKSCSFCLRGGLVRKKINKMLLLHDENPVRKTPRGVMG